MQKPIRLNPPTTTANVNGGFAMQQLNDMVLSAVTWRKGTARPDDIQDGEKWHKVDANGNTIGFFEWRTQDGAGDGKNILEYWASVTAVAGMVPLAQLDPDTGEVVFDDSWKMGGGGGMPIGASIAVYCTSTYTPFGAVPQNGASYSETQFPTVVEYIEQGFIPWVTPTDYDAEVTAHGKCGCFAWDSTARTFRVPLIPDGTFVQQAMSDSELGKAYGAGLPNITGGFIPGGLRDGLGAFGAMYADTGAFYDYNVDLRHNVGGRVIFDASKSNSTYGKSATVQPNAIALRHFVVVATETDNQSMMDWSAWATGLESKLDKEGAAGVGMPSEYSIVQPNWVYIEGGYENVFTAPANGYVNCIGNTNVAGVPFISISTRPSTISVLHVQSEQNSQIDVFLPVRKGATVRCAIRYGMTVTARFIYAQGEI